MTTKDEIREALSPAFEAKNLLEEEYQHESGKFYQGTPVNAIRAIQCIDTFIYRVQALQQTEPEVVSDG